MTSTKTVYLAWRSPIARWYPVGRLQWDGARYEFRYIRGSERAEREAGFRPLIEFRRFEANYSARALFPTFENRIPAPSYPEYRAYMAWLCLSSDADQMDILARNGGQRATDMFEVFPRAEPVDGRYRAEVFVHGLRHRTDAERARAEALDIDERLVLEHEPSNAGGDVLAVRTESQDKIHLGYMPRFLCADLHKLGVANVSATVIRVNPPPTPMQFRVLVRLEAGWPLNFEPCSGEDYAVRQLPAILPTVASPTELRVSATRD
jgi:hypothetical protein